MHRNIVKLIPLVIIFLLLSACKEKDSAPELPPADTPLVKSKTSVENKTSWRGIYVDSEMNNGKEAASNVIDGDNSTIWHTEWKPKTPQHPHEIHVDMGREYEVHGFTYMPRLDNLNGTVLKYEFYLSQDAKNWGEAVDSGEFTSLKLRRDLCSAYFNKPVKARYFRFVALSEINGKAWTSAAELNVIIEE